MTLVKSVVAMSAQPMGRPGWPELAFSTASIARDRVGQIILLGCIRHQSVRFLWD